MVLLASDYDQSRYFKAADLTQRKETADQRRHRGMDRNRRR